jgi:hypothetical protein
VLFRSYGADPGLGIVLVPLGALLLFLAVFLTALAISRALPASAAMGKSPSSPKAK